MDLAYTIVKLGRSARNGANIKNRQPLSQMLVSVASLPEYYGDIIKDELNIKSIEFGADLSEHVNFEIKPNLPVLGRAYGKMIPAIRKEIASRNQMELAQKINNGGVEVINVDVREIISKIQNMRKESGFEVADKITLYVANNDMLLDVIKKFKDTIKRETLTVEVVCNEQNIEYTESTINGEKLNMAVKVVK